MSSRAKGGSLSRSHPEGSKPCCAKPSTALTLAVSSPFGPAFPLEAGCPKGGPLCGAGFVDRLPSGAHLPAAVAHVRRVPRTRVVSMCLRRPELCRSTPAPDAPPATVEDEVRAAVERYFETWSTGNVTASRPWARAAHDPGAVSRQARTQGRSNRVRSHTTRTRRRQRSRRTVSVTSRSTAEDHLVTGRPSAVSTHQRCGSLPGAYILTAEGLAARVVVARGVVLHGAIVPERDRTWRPGETAAVLRVLLLKFTHDRACFGFGQAFAGARVAQ